MEVDASIRAVVELWLMMKSIFRGIKLGYVPDHKGGEDGRPGQMSQGQTNSEIDLVLNQSIYRAFYHPMYDKSTVSCVWMLWISVSSSPPPCYIVDANVPVASVAFRSSA